LLSVQPSGSYDAGHPDTFELEIVQPPTRDDWIGGIRDAVDACGLSDEEDLDEEAVEDREAVKRRRVSEEYRVAKVNGPL